jgi:hypothetical protein
LPTFTQIKLPVLPPFDDPSDQSSGGEACGEGHRNGKDGVSLDALRCVDEEFLGSVATLFRGAPDDAEAVLNRFGNRTRCTGSLVSGFGDVFGRSVQYGL